MSLFYHKHIHNTNKFSLIFLCPIISNHHLPCPFPLLGADRPRLSIADMLANTAVCYILEKQEYMGHTVLGKTVLESFKTKKRRKAKPEELMVFPNTHEMKLA